MDLIGVSPLVGLMSIWFIVEETVLKVVSYKVTKQKKACMDNQHICIPFTFVFDTFTF